jgi:hypothetical protein
MYRLTLAGLWAGAITFGIGAGLDAFLDYMKNAQGILIGGWAMFSIGILGHVWLHRLNETAEANGQRAQELLELSETKTAQVRGDVDKLREQVKELGGTVEEVREWQEADTLIEEASHPPTPPPPVPEPDREPCPIYQMRIRGKRGREAIVGKRTPDPIDPASIWSALEEGDAGTLPGTSAS